MVALTNSASTAVLITGLSAAVMSLLVLLVRLERLSSWSLPVRTTFVRARSPLLTFLGCEFVYAAILATLIQLVQPTRPIDFSRASATNSVSGWFLLGIVMSLFGSRLIGGALGKLLPELDDSVAGPGGHGKWASSQYREIITARERAIKQVLDVHFEAYSTAREHQKFVWITPLRQDVKDGLLTFKSIDGPYRDYLAFQQQETPAFVVRLRAASLGVSPEAEADLCDTYLEFIWRRGDAASLHVLSRGRG
jgi:hypothetical protein